MTFAILLSVLVQADGGHDFTIDAGELRGERKPLSSLYTSCPGAPPVQPLDGGWVLLPPSRAARNACLFTVCESDRSRREQEMAVAPTPPSWIFWAVGISVAAGGGYTLGKAIK